MTKTMYRIRTPEFSSGALAHARLSNNRFVDRNGALRSTALHRVRQSCTLRLRWQLDAISAKPITPWEARVKLESQSLKLPCLVPPGLSLYHLVFDASRVFAN